MPSPASVFLAARRVPWARLAWLAREAHRRGSAVSRELSAEERRRFLELLRASRGRPRSLPEHEARELSALAARAWAATRRPSGSPPAG